MKNFKEIKESLGAFYYGFDEGDNITITCDFLDLLDDTIKLLERLEKMNKSELNVLKYLVKGFEESYNEHKQKYENDLASGEITYASWYESGATNALKPVVETLNNFIRDKELN